MNKIQYLIDKGWGGQKRFAERYRIPLRTVQNWATGKRNPPEYVSTMIEALAATEESHSMGAKDEEPEKLEEENITLKYEKEELEMRLEEYRTCYKSALEEIRRLKKSKNKKG